jgi:excisionase family DNA binding protein
MSTHDTTPALLDYADAAPILKCSERMVRKLVESRQIESVKVGKLVRLEPAALAAYIARNRRPAAH